MDPNPTPENHEQPYVTPQVVPEAQPGRAQTVATTPPRVKGRFFGRLLWIVLIVSLLANMSMYLAYQSYFQSGEAIQEKFHSLKRYGRDKVAIIRIEGTIFESEGFVKAQIDKVRGDKNVKAVVVRVNSPGGSVWASDYLYHHLAKLAKERDLPLVVSMGGMAASGGYYVSMAVGDRPDTIFAEPTTWTGSIGVIIPHYNLTGLMKRWDIQDDSIASKPLKQMGSLTKEMTPEERKLLQQLVDESYRHFKEIVKAGRPAFKEDERALDEVATGQVFTAPQALKHGLVDKVGYLEDAIDRAIALANLDKEDVRVVKYTRQTGLLDELLLGPQSAEAKFDLNALLESTTPRAYYLCTWLPITTSKP
jgi:protease IV